MTTNRPLRVFLCHSSADKPAVRELYQKLRAEPWIQPWLDEEELFPGMDWNMEIEKAIEATDAIIVCLSKGSITKEGYVQRELRIVLDYADYKPEGTIYILPVRLEECEPPRRLRSWQYADYFEGNRERALQRLLVSLKRRADSLGLQTEAPNVKAEPAQKPVEKKPTIAPKKAKRPAQSPVTNQLVTNQLVTNQLVSNQLITNKPITNKPITNKLTLSNGMEFMRVPAGKFIMGIDNKIDRTHAHIVNIPYDYWMARFPVTNNLYDMFIEAKGEKDSWVNPETMHSHPVVNIAWREAVFFVLG